MSPKTSSAVCKCMYRVCVHAPECLYVCVLYCSVRAMPSFSSTKPRISAINLYKLSLSKLLSDTRGAVHFPPHTQIICKHLTVVVFPHAGSPQANPSADGDSANRVSHPAKNKVAEFVWKFKCLLANATLNLICMWTQCVVERGTLQHKSFYMVAG